MRALIEHRRVRPARPSREEICRYLAGAPFANCRATAQRFAAAEVLEPQDHKAFLRTLLYPARFCYSWMTGCMGSNDEAVAFLGEACPRRFDVPLISRALECRQADADPDPLFPARALLPSQIDACMALLSGPVSAARASQPGASSDYVIFESAVRWSMATESGPSSPSGRARPANARSTTLSRPGGNE